MFVLRIACQLVTFATIIIISRVLGPDEFGRYSFLYGFLIIFTLFNVNGLNDILVREIASRPASSRVIIYRNGLALKLIAGIFAFVLACIVILVFNISTLPKWVCCIAALTILVSFSMGSFRLVWDVPYQVDFRMTSASTVNLLGRVLFLVLLLVWLVKGSGNEITGFAGLKLEIFGISVLVVILLQTFSEITATAMQGGLNLKFGYPMLPGWNTEMIKYLLREVWPLAVAGGLVMVFTKINLLMIQYFLTERDVGLFAVPMRMVDALMIISVVFITAVLPVLSRMYRESRDKFLSLVRLSYRIMLCISFPIVAVVMFYSSAIIHLLVGESYSASAPILTILIWTAMLSFCGTVFNGILVASGNQRLLMLILGIQAIVNICMNLLLIPKYGNIGAAWVAFITYGIMFPVSLLFKQISYAGRLWLNSLVVPLLFALASGYISWVLGLSLLPALLFIPVMFYGLVIITGWISRADLVLMRDIISSRAVEY